MRETLHGYKKITSGELEMLYGHGAIRQLRLGKVQLIAAIYCAVRDKNWGTIPFSVLSEDMIEDDQGFSVHLEMEFRAGDIIYHASIRIEGKDNSLIFTFDGKARSSFLKNRIGLCILHPVKECIGKPVEIMHPGGSTSVGTFPVMISSNQPFANLAGMKWEPSPDVQAELQFTGDIFETEDQRNWTDASYKTYCTPLSEPFPVKIEKDSTVHQSVSLTVHSVEESGTPDPVDIHTLSIRPGVSRPMPGIGMGRSSRDHSLSEEEYNLLKEIPFHHYRVELWLGKAGWPDTYQEALKEQHILGWPWELVLHFTINHMDEMEEFLTGYIQAPAKISHILIFNKESLSDDALLCQVVPGLRREIPETPIGGGSDAYFAELNRKHPDADFLDFISFTICPQVHAFDKLTLVENIAGQPDTVKSARKIFHKPVSVHAITLKQRFNIVATDKGENDNTFPQADERQSTRFAAGWTLGSIGQLAKAGTRSLTYFETRGPLGIMECSGLKCYCFPLYHLFWEILRGDFNQIAECTSSDPLQFEGLLLEGTENSKLLLANYTEKLIRIRITGTKSKPGNIRELTPEGWGIIRANDVDPTDFPMKPSGIFSIEYQK